VAVPWSVAAALLFAQAAVPPNQSNAALRQRQAAATKRAAPVVHVVLFSYRPDGTVQGAANYRRLTTENVQYVAGCVIDGGDKPVPDAATDAWRVSGTILRVSPEEAVVQLEWQRLRTAGLAVTSAAVSQQLTLHPGDRVALDSATIGATGPCPAQTVEFEAHFTPLLFAWVFPPGVTEFGAPPGPGGRGIAAPTPRSDGRGGASAPGPDGTIPKRAAHAPKDQ
jgi:hypothetical protein